MADTGTPRLYAPMPTGTPRVFKTPERTDTQTVTLFDEMPGTFDETPGNFDEAQKP